MGVDSHNLSESGRGFQILANKGITSINNSKKAVV